MRPNEELRLAKVTLAANKRKLERLDREVVAQRKKIYEQKLVVKELEKKSGK